VRFTLLIVYIANSWVICGNQAVAQIADLKKITPDEFLEINYVDQLIQEKITTVESFFRYLKTEESILSRRLKAQGRWNPQVSDRLISGFTSSIQAYSRGLMVGNHVKFPTLLSIATWKSCDTFISAAEMDVFSLTDLNRLRAAFIIYNVRIIRNLRHMNEVEKSERLKKIIDFIEETTTIADKDCLAIMSLPYIKRTLEYIEDMSVKAQSEPTIKVPLSHFYKTDFGSLALPTVIYKINEDQLSFENTSNISTEDLTTVSPERIIEIDMGNYNAVVENIKKKLKDTEQEVINEEQKLANIINEQFPEFAISFVTFLDATSSNEDVRSGIISNDFLNPMSVSYDFVEFRTELAAQYKQNLFLLLLSPISDQFVLDEYKPRLLDHSQFISQFEYFRIDHMEMFSSKKKDAYFILPE
jgi:hypothetical protein